MQARFLLRLLILYSLFLSMCSLAEPYVPDDLKPWQQWVLDEQDYLDCPLAVSSAFSLRQQRAADNAANYSCVWPGLLALEVNERSARFELEAELLREDWLFLPGEKKYWPVEVQVNGKTMAVALRQNTPAVFLPAGSYRIKGRIHWEQMPKSLQLPASTGLLQFSLNNVRQQTVNRDISGRLWFVEQGGVSQESRQHDSLDLDVFRKIVDDVPLLIETRVRLTVSGSDRELLLGRFLPENSVVQSLQSALPSRIEKDGRLRVQARAGVWWLTLISRFPAPQSQFTIDPMDEAWPTQEIWVYQADRSLRTVKISGAVSVDPAQVELPAEWQTYPAYLMDKSAVLQLAEESRGDVAPAENNLGLQRNIWMDFDGGGLTIRDDITGEMNQGWRLSMSPGYVLGRAELNGQPQLITTLKSEETPGIELREGQLELMTVSRFELKPEFFGGGLGGMSATGWEHPFSSLHAVLHLPPGWRLLHAGGVDRAYGSWLENWDLLDIFLLAIISGAFGRLFGFRWGFIAGLTLIVLFHERYAPVFIWVVIAVLFALLKVIPENSFRRFLQYLLYTSLAAMVVLVLQFSIDQLRRGIYPQLEHAGSITDSYSIGLSRGKAESPATLALEEKREHENQPLRSMKSKESFLVMDQAVVSQERDSIKKGYDPDARIQTGPGQPHWGWNRFTLSWSGPVSSRQQLSLYLMPPEFSRLFHFLRVFLLVFLCAGVLKGSLQAYLDHRKITAGLKKAASSSVLLPVLMVAALSTLLHSPVVRADFPSPDMLSELKNRLSKPAACLPDCASIQSGRIAIEGDSLRMDLDIHVLAYSSVELPAQLNQWLPDSVLVDDRLVTALRQENSGQLMIALPEGVHRVVLRGAVNGEQFQLPFTAPTFNLGVIADGWQVSGLVDRQVSGGNLQFLRIRQKLPEQEGKLKKLAADPIEPFVV
ncbi:MAG: hypothetical protein KDI30_08700, partial [Pseudomonadales bacterium]|nr:hypothetical protein [Pseudomonadales bacterium]